jgi:hypothetical protein
MRQRALIAPLIILSLGILSGCVTQRVPITEVVYLMPPLELRTPCSRPVIADDATVRGVLIYAIDAAGALRCERIRADGLRDWQTQIEGAK